MVVRGWWFLVDSLGIGYEEGFGLVDGVVRGSWIFVFTWYLYAGSF